MLIDIILSLWNRISTDRRLTPTLAYLTLAMLILRTASVAKLSALLPFPISLKAKRKKAYRALSKELKVNELFPLLALLASKVKNGLNYIPVLIDYTYTIGKQEKLLVAAVPYKGRAIPIAFELIDFSLKGIKRSFEKEFIATLRKMFPSTVTIVVIMDREFCGKEFIKEVKEIGGVEVIVRLRKNASIRDGRKRHISLRFIRKSKVKCYYGEIEGSLYVKPGKERILIFSTFKNLGLAVRLYQERMWIEEMFRDLKSHFGLDEIGLRVRKRRENLIALMFVSYATLCYVDWLERSRREKYQSYIQRLLLRISLETAVFSRIPSQTPCIPWL